MVWGKLPVEYKEIEFLLEFQPKLKVETQTTVLAEFEKNAIVMLEICSMLTLKTRVSTIFIVISRRGNAEEKLM